MMHSSAEKNVRNLLWGVLPYAEYVFLFAPWVKRIRIVEIFKFDKKILRKGLKRLSKRKRLIYCLSVCDRLFPNYVAFHKKTKSGEPESLKKIIDELWNIIANKKINKEKINELLGICVKQIPDEKDINSNYVSFARNAAGSVFITLECFKMCRLKKVLIVNTMATETVMIFLGKEETEEHPLMVRELTKQRNDMIVLKLIKRR